MWELNFSTRITIVVIACLVGLFWQVGIATFGGEPSTALISAFTSVILASIALGAPSKNGKSNDTRRKHDED